MERGEDNKNLAIRKEVRPLPGEQPEDRFARIIVEGYLKQYEQDRITSDELMRQLGSWYLGAIQSEEVQDLLTVRNALNNGGVLEYVETYTLASLYGQAIESGDRDYIEDMYRTLEKFGFKRRRDNVPVLDLEEM